MRVHGSDITVLEPQVEFVIKGGAVVKDIRPH